MFCLVFFFLYFRVRLVARILMPCIHGASLRVILLLPCFDDFSCLMLPIGTSSVVHLLSPVFVCPLFSSLLPPFCPSTFLITLRWFKLTFFTFSTEQHFHLLLFYGFSPASSLPSLWSFNVFSLLF